MNKKIWLITVILLLVGVLVWLIFTKNQPVTLFGAPSETELLNNMSAAGLTPLQVEGTLLHTHQHLDIIVNGNNVVVPAEIGVGSNFISPLHTHDSTGVIHVESPVVKDFTLGQFFKEWGVTLNNNCLDNYCTNASSSLIVAVNGKPIVNPQDYILQQHDEIEVWYGKKTENPSFIKSYNFAPGL